jgi:hypothetical protein
MVQVALIARTRFTSTTMITTNASFVAHLPTALGAAIARPRPIVTAVGQINAVGAGQRPPVQVVLTVLTGSTRNRLWRS